MRKIVIFFASLLCLVSLMAAGPLLLIAFDAEAQDWRYASQNAVGWAPDPAAYQPAVFQAYAAPAVRWRGKFGDHTWIAVKKPGAATYTRYEVIGFNLRRNRSAVTESETTTPDREWYGAPPKLLRDIRGPQAEKIIAALPAAVESYPHPFSYQVWPGPNSNTFIAHVARQIPEMGLVLPGRAIGKDYTGWNIVAPTPSRTGFQISLGGMLGVTLAAGEGLEVNILGLVVGADPLDLAVTVPGIGRLPMRDDWTDGAYAVPGERQAAVAPEQD
jgi:hypothetical protein